MDKTKKVTKCILIDREHNDWLVRRPNFNLSLKVRSMLEREMRKQ